MTRPGRADQAADRRGDATAPLHDHRIVLLAFLGMLYISWERGGRVNPFEPPKNRGSFQPGEQKFE
jgi:hypothetical protein